METIQMHGPEAAQQPQPQLPEKSNRNTYIVGTLLLIAAAAAASFFVIRDVQANADYICTYISEDRGECANGSWGPWATVSETPNAAQCDITKVEKRTYTGTRFTRHIIQYLNRRTACDPGFSQALAGNTGGESGFHGGTIISESVSCQIEETRTTRAAGKGGAQCGKTTTTSVGTDTGQITGSTKDLTSKEEITQFRKSMIAGAIFARPSLVKSGGTTLVTWQAREVTSCTVTGTNGDSWTGTSGEQTSGTILDETTYTLNCIAFDGSTLTDTVTVIIAPTFKEE